MLRLPHVAQDMPNTIGTTVARLLGGPGRRMGVHFGGRANHPSTPRRAGTPKARGHQPPRPDFVANVPEGFSSDS